MAPGLRSQIHSHVQTHHQDNTSTSSTSQSGGKKRRTSKSKSKSKSASRKRHGKGLRGGSCCSNNPITKMVGGMGLGPIVKQALVPFGLFTMQKHTQRAKSHKKHKTQRRRR